MEDLGIDEKFLRPKQTRPLRDVAGSYTYFADGDVLLAKITPCFENGKLGIAVGLTNGVGFGSSEYVVLRPGHDLSSQWLYYYLSREAFRIEGAGQMAGAVGHRRVAKDFIENYPIPIPPIEDQQRIAGVLDDAFGAIATARANTEQNLRNAREVFESHLQSVFARRSQGWGVKRIEEIAAHSLGKMLDKAKNKGEFKQYLRNLNVRWFAFDLSDVLEMRFLPEEAAKYTVVRGDVLVCEGGYPGRAAIWNEDYPIHFQKALHRVRFHEPEHNKWFGYYLLAQDQSGDLKQHFGRALAFDGGVDQMNVLVSGTPAMVRNEVRKRIDQLAPGGGYILGPSQVITRDIPLENLVAMFDSALEYGKYKAA